MYLVWVVSLLALAFANAQEFASECPSPNGFFADSRQCDKYYECVENVLTDKLCPDGMAFNDFNPAVEKCDLLSQVDCTGRSQLQPAKPTEHCDRQNGNFAPKDVPNCQQAYRCVGGVSTLITCPEGLAFALETGICDWPDQSGRSDCDNKQTQNFTCPKVPLDIAVSHPRYADPHDCQYFYVCINGETPRRNGCAFGQVFNTNTSTCDSPKEVAECADYYTEYFDEYFTNLELNPGKVSADIIAAAISSGYDVPKFRDRVRIQPGAKPPTQRGTTTSSPVRLSIDTRVRKPSISNNRPPLRRRPGGIRRRKRPNPTTTTTTTTPAPDEYYYDYYYDYPEEAASSPLPDFTDNLPAQTGTDTISTNDVPVPAALVADEAPFGSDPDPVASKPAGASSATRTNVPIRRSFLRPGN